MMYKKPEKFEKDFIVRTKSLLDNYSRDYDVTLFINCMLGLLVIPKEKHPNLLTNDIIPPDMLERIVKCCRKKKEKELKEIIRHLRNAVAHGNIVFEAEKAPNGTVGTTIARITFFDGKLYDEQNKPIKITRSNAPFKFEIDYKLLKEFVLVFSDAIYDLI